MKLSIGERYSLYHLLPQKGTMAEQIIVKDIIAKILPDQAEIKRIELTEKRVPGGIARNWNVKKAKVNDIQFTELEVNSIKDAVEKADKGGDITQGNIDLCHRFKSYDVVAARKAARRSASKRKKARKS